MVHRTLARRLAFPFVLAAALAASPALAGETTVTLDGDLTPGEPVYIEVPFDVPAGTVEIQIDHDDGSDTNILDWGMSDADGVFRGWGGGNTEPAVVGVHAASRSYAPGAIMAGSWKLLVGKAQIKDSPAHYHAVVHLRDAETLPDESTLRTPYVAVAPLSAEGRWYAGDLHDHSRESGDAKPTLDEMILLAKMQGLDFMEISDHNVVSMQPFFADEQAKWADFLIVPGEEWTTYHGHANGIGATSWVDFRTHSGGVTIDQAVDAFHAQGALFSINHPRFGLGDLCIGCDWDYPDLSPAKVDGMELANGIFPPDSAVKYWNELCDTGAHIAALGGSDDHTAGQDEGAFGAPEGQPTTMVFAKDLSVASLIEGIKNGRTVVRVTGAAAPMVEFTSSVAPDGDTVKANKTTLTAHVTKGRGMSVYLVRNGVIADGGVADTDDYTATFEVAAPASGEDRYRIDVLLGGTAYRAITSHLWLKSAGGATGDGGVIGDGGGGAAPTSTSGATSGDAAEPAAGDDSGCGCRVPGGELATGPALGVAIAAAAAFARRRRATKPKS